MKRLMKLFEHILIQVNTSPEKPIEAINGTSPEDFRQICAWNDYIPSPSSDSIVGRIQYHSVTQPEATAIDAWNGSLSYAELVERSSALAVILSEHGVGKEVFVPLCFKESKYVPLAILAVAKAGGAFILLDPAHPIQQLRSICEGSDAHTVVCSQAQFETAGQLGCRQIIPVGQPVQALEKQVLAQSLQTVNGSDAFCAVFTSGSTGKPKGSILEYAAFATNVSLLGPRFRLGNTVCVLQFASHSFDAAVAGYISTLV
ncbi:hypothetical protein BJX64DRAFT_290456 [Aspergillus heterothallicus]